MADIADQSDKDVLGAVDSSLAKIRKTMAKRELEPMGACHFCSEHLGDQRLFCSVECSEDWEKQRRNRR